MLFVAMAWLEKAKGAGLRGDRKGMEPPCMEGEEDGGAWGGGKKSVHKSDRFCVSDGRRR